MENTVYRKCFVSTREDIRDQILEDKKIIENNASNDAMHSAAYYHAVISLIETFIKKFDSSVLFEKLEPLWEYEVSYSYEGISLAIKHNHFEGVDDEGREIYTIDQSYELFRVPAKYLTVEEYAKVYHVGVGTVRQWIRRAKIRTAKKYGSEWRISELSDPPKRGYSSASYQWEPPLSSIPKEFKYLEGFRSISITQYIDDKQTFKVSLWKKAEGGPDTAFDVDVNEREKLELYLIGNPEIEYVQRLQDSLIVDLMKGYTNDRDN